MLKFFHFILKDLIKDKNDISDVFFILADDLRQRLGLKASSIGKAIGSTGSTINTWKSRGRGPKLEHIEKLVEAFPELRERAKELGVPLSEDEERSPQEQEQFDQLRKILADVRAQNEELSKQIAELKEGYALLQTQIGKEKDETIKRLIGLLEKKK